MDATNEIRVGVRQLRGKLSHYLRLAAEGATVLVTSHDAVVAVIQPPPPAQKSRQPGRLRGKIWMAEDFDVLPDDILDAMESWKF